MQNNYHVKLQNAFEKYSWKKVYKVISL
jgi:hypothetical protein